MKKSKWIYILLSGILIVVLYIAMSGTGLLQGMTGRTASVGGDKPAEQSAETGGLQAKMTGDGTGTGAETGAEMPGSGRGTGAEEPGVGTETRPDGTIRGTESSARVPESGTGTGAKASGDGTETGPDLLTDTNANTNADTNVQEQLDVHKDGKYYQKVPDLKDGGYYWASAVTEGKMVKDEHGCEHTDYNSQTRSFEQLDGERKLGVRRWDNLLYSAGEYLIFEYDGTVHVSKDEDLYHPVLKYDMGGTYGIITKVPDGYMVIDEKAYTVTFYDEDFRQVRLVEGYRASENSGPQNDYPDGLVAVRHMKTGLMGFMDLTGELAIPCEYAAVSDFSNGYASVLVGAEMAPYTEDGGTVQMYNAQGGRWGIIDTGGDFVLEPSDRFENTVSEYYGGGRRFSEVRSDKTVDFMDVEENRIIETVRIGE